MVQIDTLVPRQLFGGAIELSLPERLVDVSDFRPVPDNQEVGYIVATCEPPRNTTHNQVFADANLDQSLIVEILVRRRDPNDQALHTIKQEAASALDEEVAALVFSDIATANDALSSHLDDGQERLTDADVPGLAPGTIVLLSSGQQQVSKGRQGPQAANTVQLLLAVVRLPTHATDLVLTLNTPMDISPLSAAAEHAGTGTRGAHLTATSLFRAMLHTLTIRDVALFGS